MRRLPVRSTLALAALLLAIIANHAVGRVVVASLRQLPVDQFPRQVGGWTAQTERPMDPEVKRRLPTAVSIDRVYTDAQGHEVELLLLSASDYADFHDPNWCLPAQGLTVSPTKEIMVGDQSARRLSASGPDVGFEVLYWWNGKVVTEYKYGREQIARLLSLRSRLTNEQGQSLFVRLIAPMGPGADASLTEFAQQVLPLTRELGKKR